MTERTARLLRSGSSELPAIEIPRIDGQPQLTRALTQIKDFLEKRFGSTVPLAERVITWGDMFERGMLDMRDEQGNLRSSSYGRQDSEGAVRMAPRSATGAIPGAARIASQAEVDVGVNDGAFVTPLKLKNTTSRTATQAEVNAGTNAVQFVTPATLKNTTVRTASQAEVDAGTDGAQFVTPATLKAWSLRVRKYMTTVGDGSNTSYTVTHNFGTRDVAVIVYLNSGNYEQVLPDVKHATANTVTLDFSSAPSADQYKVVVIG